jgi:hypothetical protein
LCQRRSIFSLQSSAVFGPDFHFWTCNSLSQRLNARGYDSMYR